MWSVMISQKHIEGESLLVMSMIIDIAIPFVIVFFSLLVLEKYLDWYAKRTVDDLFDSEE